MDSRSDYSTELEMPQLRRGGINARLLCNNCINVCAIAMEETGDGDRGRFCVSCFIVEETQNRPLSPFRKA